MTKKLLSILTVATMLFTMIALPVSAEKTVLTEGDYTYSLLADGTVQIDKYNGNAENIAIPAEIAGKRVTVLASQSFFGDNTKTLKTVKMPDTITALKGTTFLGCKALEKVEMSLNLQQIEMAFISCDNLKTAVIPAKVREIKAGIFSGCPNIKLEIDTANPYIKVNNDAVYSTDGKRMMCYRGNGETYIVPNGVEEIRDNVFSNEANLTVITLPETLKIIGNGAFTFAPLNKCKPIVLPKSVKKVGKYAFSNVKIKNLAIRKGMQIGENAFSGCKVGKKLTVEAKAVISKKAFYGCNELKTIRVAKGVKIGEQAFGYTTKNNGYYPCKGVKFYGYKGSTAEKYVDKCNKEIKEQNKIDPVKQPTFKFIPLTALTKATVKGVKAVKYNKFVKKSGAKQKIKVYVKKKLLKRGKDYTVAYQNNTKRGKAKVIITGINKYDGTIKRSFRIK